MAEHRTLYVNRHVTLIEDGMDHHTLYFHTALEEWKKACGENDLNWQDELCDCIQRGHDYWDDLFVRKLAGSMTDACWLIQAFIR